MILLLVMIIDVSMAPIHQEKVITTETISGTMVIPDVVTDYLLFFEVTAIPFDKNIKTDDHLLYYKQGAVPVTPKPDESHSFTIEIPHIMDNISYNKI